MMRRAWHVALMGEVINLYKILLQTLKGKHHFEDLSVGGSTISKWILENYGRKKRTGFFYFRIRTGGWLL
jgi:hypothetical protein